VASGVEGTMMRDMKEARREVPRGGLLRGC